MTASCVCGATRSYADCCGLFIETGRAAPTPEALMRSRYTAFTQSNIAYLIATMRGAASQGFNEAETREWASHVKWHKLEVLGTRVSGNDGTVEFKAYFTHHHQLQLMHEISQFKLIDGCWYYVDGQSQYEDNATSTTRKIGRNDPCSCGSNIKYKKCCGK